MTGPERPSREAPGPSSSGPGTSGAGRSGPSTMIADALAGVYRLVQGELALARAEAMQRVHLAREAVVHLAIAVLLGIVALNVLAGAAVAGLVAAGLGPVWSALLVGGVLGLLALGYAQYAARLGRDVGAPPRESAASLKRDLETIQTMVKNDV